MHVDNLKDRENVLQGSELSDNTPPILKIYDSNPQSKKKRILTYIIVSVMCIAIFIGLILSITVIPKNANSSQKNNVQSVVTVTTKPTTFINSNHKNIGLGVSYAQMTAKIDEDYNLRRYYEKETRTNLGDGRYKWVLTQKPGEESATLQMVGTIDNIEEININIQKQVIEGFGDTSVVFIKPVLYNVDQESKAFLEWYEDIIYHGEAILTEFNEDSAIGKFQNAKITFKVSHNEYLVNIVPELSATEKYINQIEIFTSKLKEDFKATKFSTVSKSKVQNKPALKYTLDITNLSKESNEYSLRIGSEDERKYDDIFRFKLNNKQFETSEFDKNIKILGQSDNTLKLEMIVDCKYLQSCNTAAPIKIQLYSDDYDFTSDGIFIGEFEI